MTDSLHAPARPPAIQPRLALAGITKSYPGVIANSDISLSVQPGDRKSVV